MASVTLKPASPASVQSGTLPAQVPERFPFSVSLEGFQLALDHVKEGEETALRFQRLGLNLHYPLWRLPGRGQLGFGVERADLRFHSGDNANKLDLGVEAESDPTFFIAKGLEFYVVGHGQAPSLLTSRYFDVFGFARAAWSVYPKTFKHYQVGLETDNDFLHGVDVNGIAQQNIKGIHYEMEDFDAGLGFRFHGFDRIKPLLRLGISHFDASVFVDYEPSGRQLMKAFNINHGGLQQGRFDFNENYLNASLGGEVRITRWLHMAVEGRWIPSRASLGDGLDFFAMTEETSVTTLQLSFNLALENVR